MFLFITKLRPSQSANKPIQIHLMFLFILKQKHGITQKNNSNTSHVLIYPYALSFTEKEDRFKYISCFYLSLQAR